PASPARLDRHADVDRGRDRARREGSGQGARNRGRTKGRQGAAHALALAFPRLTPRSVISPATLRNSPTSPMPPSALSICAAIGATAPPTIPPPLKATDMPV